MRNIYVKLFFEIRTSGSGDDVEKISYREL